MNLVALLSWFDEQPAWLAGCVSSLAKAQVDHLVAIDGAYVLYPDSTKRWRSPLEQHQAIIGAAHGIDLSYTLVTKTGPWFGNEVEKRNALFDFGRLACQTEQDWFLIIDSDEYIQTAFQVKETLAEIPDDVAYYRLNEPDGTPNYVRGLYRNHPDLHIRTTHYGYSHGDQLLWDGSGTPAGVLTDQLELGHRERTGRRNELKWQYYRARDEAQIEHVA